MGFVFFEPPQACVGLWSLWMPLPQDRSGTRSDSTYTGEADSFGGRLTVEVIVSGGQIADVSACPF